MSFLKSLFGKKQKYIDDQEFTDFFNDAVSRYFCDPEGKMKIVTTDDADIVVPPSHLYNDAYEEWKTIQSVWDRRTVVYNVLDKVCLKHLDKWQLIERLTIDRRPDHAARFIEEQGSADDFKNADFLTSAARCYFYLSSYEKAIQYARAALEMIASHKRARLILADALHLTGDHDTAHRIYKEVLSESNLKETTRTAIGLDEIVDFHNDIVHSSVYAVALLNDSGEIDEGMWIKVATEFYHCPYFRSQHAYWLFGRKEHLKGLAKLIAISTEFPWFRDAIVNGKKAILQFREQTRSSDFAEEELAYMDHLIEKNNWT